MFLLHLNLGNIPPLVRLLQAYIEKASKVIIETKKEVIPAPKTKKINKSKTKVGWVWLSEWT